MSHLINPQNVFVIIPAYNENPILGSVIQQLLPYNYKLVVIDDGSATSPYSLLKKMPVYLLRHRTNLGQGAAIQTGIEFTLSKKAEYIVTFDADGQHDASDIEKMLQTLVDNKIDIALGSRFMKRRPVIIFRQSESFCCNWPVMSGYFFTGFILTDAHNGLRAMTRFTAAEMRIQENGMAHATEILSLIKRKKLRYLEVPVNIHYTDYSLKKARLCGRVSYFFDILLNKIFR